MRPWSRSDTQDWISQVECRLDDITYYIKQTLAWCEDNNVDEQRDIFTCCFITVIWVSNMREEPITYKELLEILGFPDQGFSHDKLYDLGPQFRNLDHEEILRLIAGRFDNF